MTPGYARSELPTKYLQGDKDKPNKIMLHVLFHKSVWSKLSMYIIGRARDGMGQDSPAIFRPGPACPAG